MEWDLVQNYGIFPTSKVKGLKVYKLRNQWWLPARYSRPCRFISSISPETCQQRDKAGTV